MEEFYITLPSNVRNEYFSNTVSHYKTKLAQQVSLDDSWMVGLASVSYTRSWNIKVEKAIILIFYWHYLRSNYVESNVSVDLSDYDNIESLLEEINKHLSIIERSENFQIPRIKLNKITNRIEIHNSIYDNTVVILVMTDNLCKVLGISKYEMDRFSMGLHTRYWKEFDSLPPSEIWKIADSTFNYIPDKPPENKELILYADEPYNLDSGYTSLYLYSDIVKHSFVGDSFSQLLRIIEVPTDSKFRDQILFNYVDIHYIPLLIKDFNTIEIHLKDDSGESIPFLFGRTIVTLHSKKINERLEKQ